jgi:hypothetical protein
MDRKERKIRALKPFDFMFFGMTGAAIGSLVMGYSVLYCLGILAIAFVGLLLRLVIQKHNYQNLTPTEKEIYLENRNGLEYRPKESKKTEGNGT